MSVGIGVLVAAGVSDGPGGGVLAEPTDVDVGGGGPGGGPGGSSSGGSVGFPNLNHGVFFGVGVGVEVASISKIGVSVALDSSNSPIASTVAATAVSTAPGSSEVA